jgi:hypothetical protein
VSGGEWEQGSYPLRLEVKPMLMIEGVEYGPCGICHNWYPIEEQCWSYNYHAWVCYEHIFVLRRDR